MLKTMLKSAMAAMCSTLVVVLCAAFGMSCAPNAAQAVEAPIAVVSGNFIYARADTAGDAAIISYQVEAATYHAIDAWRIAWSDVRMDAVHYIRRSDGAPLYTKRVNHALQRSVEISYSLDPSKPHVYRRESRDETLIRRIRQPGLIDLGTLPQVLSGLYAAKQSDELYFSAIDYDDGEVYELLAKRIGYATVSNDGKAVHCAIFETNLDSWLAAFNPAVRIHVPTHAGLSNFATYSGPDPAGSGEMTTLRMVSRSGDVASLSIAQPSSILAH